MKTWISGALALAALLSLCACGQYHEAIVSPEDDTKAEVETTVPEQESEPAEAPYTVTLMHNGKVFTAADGILAQWTDGYSYHTAPFVDGKAEIAALDGDFRVTLSGLPEGYTYDPNAYTATVTGRDVQIELMRVDVPRGAGSDEYHCIALGKTGYYRAQYARAGQLVFFEFVPTTAGTYVLESLVDTAAQQYNPVLMVYYGSSQFKIFDHEQVSSVLVSQFNFIQSESLETALSGCTVLEFDIDATIGVELYAQSIGCSQVVPSGNIYISGIKSHNHLDTSA